MPERLAFLAVSLAVVFTPRVVLAQQARPKAAPTPIFQGYAYPTCGPSNAPAIHVVLLVDAIPETIPARPPRPSIELFFNANVHRLLGQSATFRVDSPKGPVALTCPVVGNCTVAQSGEVMIQRRDSDRALIGEFRIVWPDASPRPAALVRRFVAIWRDAATKCH
jgi:hypothetical protein